MGKRKLEPIEYRRLNIPADAINFVKDGITYNRHDIPLLGMRRAVVWLPEDATPEHCDALMEWLSNARKAWFPSKVKPENVI